MEKRNKSIYVTLALAAVSASMLVSGCLSVQGGSKGGVSAVFSQLALIAPDSEDEAVDGERSIQLKYPFRLEVRAIFSGLWLDEDVLKATRVEYTGISMNYESEPFAWRLGVN